mgnify:CR=1 FL=1
MGRGWVVGGGKEVVVVWVGELTETMLIGDSALVRAAKSAGELEPRVVVRTTTARTESPGLWGSDATLIATGAPAPPPED